MIDGDPATDGLSLFLLGQSGQKKIKDFGLENTFIGALDKFQKDGFASFHPYQIHRRGDDHGVTYDAVISGNGIYGLIGELTNQLAVPDLDRKTFRSAIRSLFDQLRASGEYSYVLVDTRGGFAFESTDVCALADSFIVITEPDFTSFYQDRNLVARINQAAKDLESPSVLRAVIVNKGTDVLEREDKPYLDNIEVSFRNELVKEFNIRFDETHPVPVALEALLAYKVQKIPYVTAPWSPFAFATLTAFTEILGIVTSRWSIDQVDKWNELVEIVAAAISEKKSQEDAKERALEEREKEWIALHSRLREADEKLAVIQHQLLEKNTLYEREFERTQMLLGGSTPKAPPTLRPTSDSVWTRMWIGAVSLVLVLAVLAFWWSVHSHNLQQAALAQSARDALAQSQKTQEQIKTLQDQAKDYEASVVGSATEAPPAQSAAKIPDTKDGQFAVLVSAGRNQKGTALEVKLLWRVGYRSVSVYQKNGIYRTAVLFGSAAQASSAIPWFQGQSRTGYLTAYAVDISSWCANKEPEEPVKGKDPVTGNSYSVPVWSCDQPAQ